MKRLAIALVVGIIMGVLIMVFVQSIGTVLPESMNSEEENSFQDVIPRLNSGGSLFMYVSSEKLIPALVKRIEKLKKIILTKKELNEEKEIDIEAGFGIIERIINHSGLDEISGLGLSMILLDNGLNHSKMIFHHYKGENDGLLWNLFKRKPHRLKVLNLLPANTVMAAFNDFHPQYLWQWLRKQIGESDIFPLQKMTVILDSSLKMQGVDLDQLLPSMNGEIGVVMTLNADRKIKIHKERKET